MVTRSLFGLSLLLTAGFATLSYYGKLPAQSKFSEETLLKLGKPAAYTFSDAEKRRGVKVDAHLSPEQFKRPLPPKADLHIRLLGALAKDYKVTVVDGYIGKEEMAEPPVPYIKEGPLTVWLLDGLKPDGNYKFTILIYPESVNTSPDGAISAINQDKGIKVSVRTLPPQ